MANILNFEEDREGKMRVKLTQVQSGYFVNNFEVISKIGEGSFGEAFKVRSKMDGQVYAIKKAKAKYIGYRDREQKLSEVYKAFRITRKKQTQRQ